MHLRKRTLRAAAAAVAALALAPAAASADSIVFVKDGNVWLAKGDGTGLYQVTTDGTAESPYRSPSQADDGTIAASFNQSIRVMRQNGAVVKEIDPRPLKNSVSHPMDGTPVDVAISPDGRRIAYTFADFSCPIGASCGARTATGYVGADGTPLPGNLYLNNPSWATTSRTLLFGGYLHQVNVHDFGTASDVHWFDDHEVIGPEYQSTDLGDGELTRAGDRLALVRGYGEDAHIMWYGVNGNALSGPPPANPTMQCATGELAGLHGPTWSPDGQSLAWGEPDGVWVKRNAASCDTPQPVRLIAGASEPDWGPANVNPGPRGGGGGTPGAADPAKPALAVRKASLKRIARRGLKLSITCPAACTVKATATVDRRAARKLKARKLAKRTMRLGAAGTATVTLKPGPKIAKRLAKLRRATLTVKATVTPGGTLTRKVRVGR